MNIEPWLLFLGGLATVIGSTLASRYAGRASVKAKELDVESLAYQRADGLNEGIFKRLNDEIASLRTDRDADRQRIANVEAEVKEVRNYNNQLITFIYKMIAIFRRHELLSEIDPKDVPDGIHL
jgi:hypothetical protein